MICCSVKCKVSESRHRGTALLAFPHQRQLHITVTENRKRTRRQGCCRRFPGYGSCQSPRVHPHGRVRRRADAHSPHVLPETQKGAPDEDGDDGWLCAALGVSTLDAARAASRRLPSSPISSVVWFCSPSTGAAAIRVHPLDRACVYAQATGADPLLLPCPREAAPFDRP